MITKSYYKDECFCPHCDTDTTQVCRDDQHERDSSQNFRSDMEDIKFYSQRC
jgi:hypothetical protein